MSIRPSVPSVDASKKGAHVPGASSDICRSEMPIDCVQDIPDPRFDAGLYLPSRGQRLLHDFYARLFKPAPQTCRRSCGARRITGIFAPQESILTVGV